MSRPSNAEYYERCAFQRVLDKAFPQGAVCAVLKIQGGHLRPGARSGVSGRLFCSGARQSAKTGQWENEILIDARTPDRTTTYLFRVWVSGITRRVGVEGLWEAEVLGEPGELLRLNAAPPPHLRPSSQMRSAATRAHGSELFPDGILEQPSASGPVG